MATNTRNWILAGLFSLVAACGGGGGGGDRAAGVQPGPPPPGQPVPPDPIPPAPSPVPYAEAEQLRAFITSATIPADARPVIEWQLTDGNGTAIIDLSRSDVRFTLAKLQASPLGNFTGSWQSYINRVSDPDPDEGDGTEPRLQATYEGERNTQDGEFTNNGDGTYRYRMVLNVEQLDTEVLEQAEVEGLDLSYEPGLVHRVGMQFDNAQVYINPTHDWVPATGATEGLMAMDIAATDNCNRCHDPLRIHGRRVEVKYCVTCHNPGSTDPSSTNTVDMKVMVHKIHMGENLPSVAAGGEYIVGGHDYSGLGYPQDIRNCTSCHAGTGTIGEREGITLTSQGDNWSQYASRSVCGSCHEDEDWASHQGGQLDDSACNSCHSTGGDAGSIADSHRILSQEARATIAAEILAIDNTGQGEIPSVEIRVSNPQTGEAYDILNDPVWTDRSSRLRVRIAWDTRDYHNTGNQEDDASSISTNANEEATPIGDGAFRVQAPIPIPDGSEYPGLPATGSGVAVVEGRAVMELEAGADPERVSLTNVHAFFSIDEPDGRPVPRRDDVDGEVVELGKCLSCHVTLAFHGGSRADNIDSCVTCHNPRNTDLEDRQELEEPPVDGLKEQVVDMKIMVHGIHAASIRETPLQIADEVFDEENVHFPGNLANCTTCHSEEGYWLPLSEGVLAPTMDTGADLQDPRDDTVATPTAAVCSSCHDSQLARAHMISEGASFATTQAAIDNGDVVEQCAVCHGEGRLADVAAVHAID